MPSSRRTPVIQDFILSAGHASTLLYSLPHLAGVKAVNRKYETMGELAVPLDDLKNFRQLESKCPGHPEYRWTSGVETTTGPLGQGVATSVGVALASKWLAERYNRPMHCGKGNRLQLDSVELDWSCQFLQCCSDRPSAV